VAFALHVQQIDAQADLKKRERSRKGSARVEAGAAVLQAKRRRCNEIKSWDTRLPVRQIMTNDPLNGTDESTLNQEGTVLHQQQHQQIDMEARKAAARAYALSGATSSKAKRPKRQRPFQPYKTVAPSYSPGRLPKDDALGSLHPWCKTGTDGTIGGS
jgi:hypothetical protein